MATSYLTFEQRDALVNLFKAELGPSGKLNGILDVRKSIQLLRLPSIGVQPLDVVISGNSTSTKEVKNKFCIIVGTQSLTRSIGGGNTQQANLDDAMEQLQPFIEDSNGNGIVSILKSKSNFTLGGTAGKTTITEIKFDWVMDAASSGTGRVEAYAQIDLETASIIQSLT